MLLVLITDVGQITLVTPAASLLRTTATQMTSIGVITVSTSQLAPQLPHYQRGQPSSCSSSSSSSSSSYSSLIRFSCSFIAIMCEYPELCAFYVVHYILFEPVQTGSKPEMRYLFIVLAYFSNSKINK